MARICVTFDNQYQLAHDIARSFGAEIRVPTVTQFADGEIAVSLWQDFLWYEHEILLVQPLSGDPQRMIMQTLLLLDAIRQRGVKNCTWIVPYCAYARQLYDPSGEYAGGMTVLAAMIQAIGVHLLVVVEPHQDIRSCFSIPLTICSITHDIVDAIIETEQDLTNACVVAPDRGAVDRAQYVATALGLPLVSVAKQRVGVDEPRVLGVHGYNGYTKALVIDDIFDTGNTALSVARVLSDLGVEKIIGYFAHGVFSRGIACLQTSLYERVYVSPTIPLPDKVSCSKLHVFAIKKTVNALVALLQQK